MKLIEFNRNNSSTWRPGKAQVSVNCETGVLCFTKEAINAMNLKEYDKMKFFQDSETKDWYINPTKAPDGFPLRKKATMIYTNSSKVARLICEGVAEKRASFLISQQGENKSGYMVFLIIKSSAIVRDKKSK